MPGELQTLDNDDKYKKSDRQLYIAATNGFLFQNLQ